MSERLTDEELAKLRADNVSNGDTLRRAVGTNYDVMLAVDELKARRARDLDATEIKALDRLNRELRNWPEVKAHFENNHRHALAVLFKLLNVEGEKT